MYRFLLARAYIFTYKLKRRGTRLSHLVRAFNIHTCMQKKEFRENRGKMASTFIYCEKKFFLRKSPANIASFIFLRRPRTFFIFVSFYFQIRVDLRLFVASSSFSFRKRSQVPKHWSRPINFACGRWLMGNEGIEDREGSRSYQAESATWPHETMTSRCGWRETPVAFNYYVPYRDLINSSCNKP